MKVKVRVEVRKAEMNRRRRLKWSGWREWGRRAGMPGSAKQQEGSGWGGRSNWSVPNLCRWGIGMRTVTSGRGGGIPGRGRSEGQGWYTGHRVKGEVGGAVGGDGEVKIKEGR